MGIEIDTKRRAANEETAYAKLQKKLSHSTATESFSVFFFDADCTTCSRFVKCMDGFIALIELEMLKQS